MSIRDMFRRQRTPQGLEELLGMMSNGSKPAKPGKITITKVEFGADFVTQLVETGLEQFGILDAIKKSAEEQVEEIRRDAQRQVDDAVERLQQERREARTKERSKSMIEMEVREFINGQIYPFQVTHQALAKYTGRHTDRFDSVHPEVESYVRRYRDGNPHRCGDPDCTADKITQTLDYYVELERLAQTMMAEQTAADDDDYRRWAEEEDAGEGENEVEETEPVAEKAGGEPEFPYGTQQW